jgi:hypothetical protein
MALHLTLEEQSLPLKVKATMSLSFMLHWHFINTMNITVADTNGHSHFLYFQCIHVSFFNKSNLQQPQPQKTANLTILFSPGIPNERTRGKYQYSTHYHRKSTTAYYIELFPKYFTFTNLWLIQIAVNSYGKGK